MFLLGKAARGLLDGARTVLGDRLGTVFMVAPRRSGEGLPADVEFHPGNHPVPGADSFAAGRAALDWARARGSRSVLALLSGGGSAMLECSADLAVAPESAVVELNRMLLERGLPIRDANRVRALVSAVKGGGLGDAFACAATRTWVLSDVPSGAFDCVSSGPMRALVHDESFDDFARRIDLTSLLPEPLRSREAMQWLIARGRGRSSDGAAPVELLADAASVVQRLAQEPAIRTFAGSELVVECTGDDLADGPVADLVERHLARAEQAVRVGRPTLVLSVGEADVRVHDPSGRGGRNQEFALRFALALERRATDATVLLLSGASDGVDGNTDDAGAIVDRGTIGRIRAAGRDPEQDLARSRSNEALRAGGELITTGPTGTNVRDFRAALVLPGAG